MKIMMKSLKEFALFMKIVTIDLDMIS